MKIKSEIPLRLGLGAVYIYSGLGMIRNPENWAWYIPSWLTDVIDNFISINSFLTIQGIAEITIGAITLAWFLRSRIIRNIAILGAIHITGIMLVVGLNAATFRDLGLLGGWLTLVMIQRRTAI